MRELKISVVTPSFNSGDTLPLAVKSVCDQNYKNTEHIIIDGGSTDSTIDFLKSTHHLTWISEQDNGQSDAMNKGFQMATGNIIVYLNADDLFLPGAFEAVIHQFKKGEKFVMGDVLVKQESGNYEWINTPKYTFHDMLKHWEANAFCVNPVGYFYLKEVQEKIPFNLNNHDSMDLEFLLEVSLRYKIKKIDTTLGIFNYSQNCKTGQNQSTPKYWTSETWPYIENLAKEHLKEKEFKNFIKQRDWGYQKRRQSIIQSIKDTQILEDLIEEEKVDLLPSTDLHFQSHINDISYSRVIPFNEFVFEGDNVIVVHQVGKVASTSITMKLATDCNYKPVYHTHVLDTYIKLYLSKNNNSLNHFSYVFSRSFEKHKNKLIWHFITLVRDPISIAISLFFQIISVTKEYKQNEKVLNQDYVRDKIINSLNTYILPYFVNEYKRANIIDIYSYPFDKTKSWQIINNKNINVLIMKYENVNNIFSDAIEEFLGIPNLTLRKDNVTSDKDEAIAKNYQKMKNEIKFDSSFLDQVYTHPFVTHFYTDIEIEKMREKWEEKDKTTDSKNTKSSENVIKEKKWTGLIYDLGLNTGQDTDFYLKKGFKVVAIDANPTLTKNALEKFSEFIETGQLIVLNIGIAEAKDTGNKLKFYYNEHMTEWGSFDMSLGWRSIEPWFTKEQEEEGKKCIEVECNTFGNIIETYGTPYYTKIDIEGFDYIALESMLKAGIHPKYISVENGGEKFLSLLKDHGYNNFKYVPMHNVPNQKLPKEAKEGLTIEYCFPYGSSGAFGEETPGEWVDFETIKKQSKYSATPEAMEKGHWFDVHACAKKDLPK